MPDYNGDPKRDHNFDNRPDVQATNAYRNEQETVFEGRGNRISGQDSKLLSLFSVDKLGSL